MRSINKVILIGNVGKDPDVQVFEGGRKKSSFSLATTERYRDRTGADQAVTEWHNCVVWGPQAEVVEKYVRKGTPLYVEGRIKYRDYTDKDGVKRRVTEIFLENFSMLSNRSGSDSGTEISSHDSGSVSSQDSDPMDPPLNKIEDDLPF